MKINFTSLSLAFTALFCLGYVNTAAGLELKPGLWGVTITTQTPMAETPTVDYTEECIEAGYDPLADLMMEDIGSCEISTDEDSASRLSLGLQCSIEGAGQVDGKILFTVNGEVANGNMSMVMNMGGMSMTMESRWDGKHLGSCSL